MNLTFNYFKHTYPGKLKIRDVMPEEIASLRAVFPEDLCDFLEEEGYCSYGEGFFIFTDPEEHRATLQLFNMPEGHHVFFKTATGTFFTWNGTAIYVIRRNGEFVFELSDSMFDFFKFALGDRQYVYQTLGKEEYDKLNRETTNLKRNLNQMRTAYFILLLALPVLSGCLLSEHEEPKVIVLRPGDFWVESFDAANLSSCAFVNDKIYCSSANRSNDLPDYLYCLDLRTGKVDWRHEIEAYATRPPIVLDTMLYFSTYLGNIHCLTPEGKVKWMKRHSMSFADYGLNPVNNNLFCSSVAGALFEYDANTGNEVDTIGYGDGTMGTTLPVFDGKHKLYASFIPRNEKSELSCMYDNGRAAWKRMFGQIERLYAANGYLFFVDDKNFWCLKITDGKTMWSQPNTRNWDEKISVEGNTVYLSGASIKAFDVVSGKKVSKVPQLNVRTFNIKARNKDYVARVDINSFSPLNGCEVTVEEK